MKSFDRLIAVFVLVTAVAFIAVNAVLLSEKGESGKLYSVEIGRIVREIEATGNIPDVSGYTAVTGVYEQNGGSEFFDVPGKYSVRMVNGKLYRFDYVDRHDNSGTVLFVNAALGVLCAAVLVLLLYIRFSIIKPFGQIRSLPLELAKGGLTVPLKESRSRYFGKFIWGLDMLREKTEESRRSELELLKEKKTMLMSLSHDIKTPLSAIKLYSAALEKGIYTDPQKQKETARSIGDKADEIEHLVNEIMRSGTEDIVRFEVKETEFYLSEVISRISVYYRDKLTGTRFTVGEYNDCIIIGDPDRLEEVLQNIIENAVKYGDGHRISLSFADEEDCRLITVTNSGCTLPEEELAHIFDSFWRGSNVGSRNGNGLGLYICRQLTRAMGGDIYAEIRGDEMNVTVVCRK